MTAAELAAIRDRYMREPLIEWDFARALTDDEARLVSEMRQHQLAHARLIRADVRALLAEVERLRGADVRCAEYEKEVRDLLAKEERLW